MGDKVLIRIKGDKVIWMIIVLLALISMAAVYSSSVSLAFREGKSPLYFLIKQGMFIIMGIVMIFISSKIPIGWYRGLTKLMMIVSGVLLILTFIIGNKVNDAGRWLTIARITFQPSEITKIVTILYVALMLETQDLTTYKRFFFKLILPVGIIIILILIGSASTAIFLSGLVFLILVVAGVKKGHLLKSIGVVAIIIPIMLAANMLFNSFTRIDTMMSRIKRHSTEQVMDQNLTPHERQRILDQTFQADVAKATIASAKFSGKGPGKSTLRYVLPHPYSDFIYSIIVEEWGVFGGITILLLYTILLYRCIAIAKKCVTTFSAISVIGIGLLITMQAMLHIFVNVGLLPVTGHTLPLISLGGTSIIIISIAFGFVLAVSKATDKTQEITTEEEIVL